MGEAGEVANPDQGCKQPSQQVDPQKKNITNKVRNAQIGNKVLKDATILFTRFDPNLMVGQMVLVLPQWHQDQDRLFNRAPINWIRKLCPVLFYLSNNMFLILSLYYGSAIVYHGHHSSWSSWSSWSS